MTLRTIGSNTVFYELPVVVINMAISAPSVFQRIREFPLMTGFAVNDQVFLLKFVICFVMVKIL